MLFKREKTAFSENFTKRCIFHDTNFQSMNERPNDYSKKMRTSIRSSAFWSSFWDSVKKISIFLVPDLRLVIVDITHVALLSLASRIRKLMILAQAQDVETHLSRIITTPNEPNNSNFSRIKSPRR